MKRNVKVELETGLHARPAALFVQTASRFASQIWIEKAEKKVNAKSIMGIMSLGVAKGNEVTIVAEGEDAEEALEALVILLEKETV